MIRPETLIAHKETFETFSAVWSLWIYGHNFLFEHLGCLGSCCSFRSYWCNSTSGGRSASSGPPSVAGDQIKELKRVCFGFHQLFAPLTSQTEHSQICINIYLYLYEFRACILCREREEEGWQRERERDVCVMSSTLPPLYRPPWCKYWNGLVGWGQVFSISSSLQ